VPAAAGGPKGLILQSLDQWLFGEWLPSAPRERSLIGASIGAWRMAAACHPDPVDAFARLGALYCGQRYPQRPSAQYISDACIDLLQAFVGRHAHEVATHPGHRLHILTARGRGLLDMPRSGWYAGAGFGLATLANSVSRRQLARHLTRVVVGDARDPVFWLKARFDAFDTEFVPLDAANLAPALLASGTLPFTMQPVSDIPAAPPGSYWDGGLIDYHLALPYARLAGNAEGGLVLYPHFGARIVPGWLDKSLPWRHAARGRNRNWLDNVVMVSPSEEFLKTLPLGRLPDRRDFHHYGQDHEQRILNWKRAIAEGERLRDELVALVEKPDIEQIQPF